MDTGTVIKKLRKSRKITQNELAQKLGVNKSSIQKYENGMVHNLKIRTIRELCETFRVPPWYFIYPERVRETNTKHSELQDQALFFLNIFLQQTDEGRKRMCQYIEDHMHIEKYWRKEPEYLKKEMDIMKKTIKGYLYKDN